MQIPELEIHPLSLKYPWFDDETFVEVEKDMVENGIQMSIILYEGKILDGKNRYRIARKNGLSVKFSNFEGTPEEAAALSESLNARRRMMTKSQLAMSLVKEGIKPDEVDPKDAGKRTMYYASVVHTEASPELAQAVTDGLLSVRLASDLTELPRPMQQQLVNQIRSGQVKNVSAVAKQLLKSKRSSTKAAVKPPVEHGDAHEGDDDADQAESATIHVPKHLKDIFSEDCPLEVILPQLRNCKKVLQDASSWHPYILTSEAVASLDTIIDSVLSNLPASVCEHCQGDGCGECRHSGWIPRWREQEMKS